MKKQFLALILVILTAMQLQAQDIQLNKPDLQRKTTLMTALSDRASYRESSDKELTLQDLSDLLWAANGINRPESGKRTAPSAINAQDIDIYVLTRKAVYRYDAKANKLVEINKGDHRKAVAGQQDFVMQFPVSLVMVSDNKAFTKMDEMHAYRAACTDAAYVSANIGLFCTAAGLVTVPRISMDENALRSILKLHDGQTPILNNPVGYPAK